MKSGEQLLKERILGTVVVTCDTAHMNDAVRAEMDLISGPLSDERDF